MRAVELFSGCGGMSLGFQNAGFEIVAAYEYWDAAVECYSANFRHPVRKADLSDMASAIPAIASDRPDAIIGGPPCQDFSSAGKRVESDRASLTVCYARIVDAVRPRLFVMENVARSLRSGAYGEAREIFKGAGYGLTEAVLDASLCGVPQSRKRLICVGALGEADGFMAEGLRRGLAERPLTLREHSGGSLGFEFYYRHPRNYSRRAIFSVDEPAPTMRGVNRPVPKGYRGNPGDACPPGDGVRPLTTLERAMVQTFPPSFVWTGSKTENEQMIGNAVPVKLAEHVARAVMGHFAPDPGS
jgi:DNA (cytosine-5)-methyltransferase 1